MAIRNIMQSIFTTKKGIQGFVMARGRIWFFGAHEIMLSHIVQLSLPISIPAAMLSSLILELNLPGKLSQSLV